MRRGKQTGKVCGYVVEHWVACVGPWFALYIEKKREKEEEEEEEREEEE